MLPKDSDEYISICQAVERADVLAVDTETTGLHHFQDDVLRGICVAYPTESGLAKWYLPISHPASRNYPGAPIARALRRTQALVLMHNSPFDMNVLSEAGLEIPPLGNLWDTQVADWLINENAHHGLKEIGARTFGGDAMDERAHLIAVNKETGRSWETFTAEDIAEYGAKDAELTLRVYDHQLKTIVEQDTYSPEPDLKREMNFQFVVRDLIRTGIRVDQERAERQYGAALARRTELREHFSEINMNSPQQLGELVYDKWDLECYLQTPKGKRSTSKEALEPWAEVDPRVAEILEHRRMDKACSGFYEPLAKRVGKDGRIHPSFSSARTVTGRLSCSDPNLQTIPREDVLKGIRKCFIPAEGTELWEYDLDSAELRVIGAVTREEGIFSAMAEGRDLHSETAAMVFGPNFTPLQRRLAKNMNYGYPYGIGKDKLARYLAAGPPRRPMTPELVAEAGRMKKTYARTYPRMTAMMRRLSDVAKRDGVIPLHKPGRFRHFKSPGRPVGYYTALNAIVQGAVAEIMKDVMLEFAGTIDGAMCLQVHDSLVVEVAPGDGPEVGRLLQGIVDEVNPFPSMPMPLTSKVWGT